MAADGSRKRESKSPRKVGVGGRELVFGGEKMGGLHLGFENMKITLLDDYDFEAEERNNS